MDGEGTGELAEFVDVAVGVGLGEIVVEVELLGKESIDRFSE